MPATVIRIIITVTGILKFFIKYELWYICKVASFRTEQYTPDTALVNLRCQKSGVLPEKCVYAMESRPRFCGSRC